MKKIILTTMILCLSQYGQAAVIQIKLTGLVDYVDDPYNLLEDSIHQGDSLTGFYIYDSETTDSDPSIYYGTYEYTSAPFGMSLTVGDMTFQTDPADVDFVISITNNYNGEMRDKYGVSSHSNLGFDNGITIDHLNLQLNDYTGLSLLNDELSIPDLSRWNDSKTFSISGGSYPFPSPSEKTLFTINGHVTSVTPEPGTLLLFMMGAVALYRKNSKKY